MDKPQQNGLNMRRTAPITGAVSSYRGFVNLDSAVVISVIMFKRIFAAVVASAAPVQPFSFDSIVCWLHAV